MGRGVSGSTPDFGSVDGGSNPPAPAWRRINSRINGEKALGQAARGLFDLQGVRLRQSRQATRRPFPMGEEAM